MDGLVIAFFGAAAFAVILVDIGMCIWNHGRGRSSVLAYTPRFDRVIVKRLPMPPAPPDQMLLPNSQRRQLNEGTVIAIGPKIYDLKVGQHICFLEFSGTDIEIDGESYLSLRSEEIHGVRA